MLKKFVVLAPLLASPLWAQTPAASDAVARAAMMITPASLARQVAALSVDSLWGRTTPSAAIERTAQYLVTAFKDSTTLVLQRQSAALLKRITAMSSDTTVAQDTAAQRKLFAEFQKVTQQLELESEATVRPYSVPGRKVKLNAAESSINFGYSLRGQREPVIREGGDLALREIQLPFATSARFGVARVPEINNRWKFAPATMVLTGRPTAAFLRKADIADKTVLYVPPADLDSAVRQAIFEDLYRASLGTLVLVRGDSARFAVTQAQRLAQPLELVDVYLQDGEDDSDTPRPWVIEARAPIIEDLLERLGMNLAQADTAHAPAVRPLPDLRVWHTHLFDTTGTTTATAPTVAKFFEGSDSVLKKQCLVLVAPLDQRELPAGGSLVDSAARQGDPSTMSLAGLVELARVFRTARPQRSLLFLATSGGAPGQLLWGSHGYLYELWNHRNCDPVLTLSVDFGLGGAGAGDTVVISGMDEVKLALPPAWVAAAHPELGLTIANGGTVTAPRSDAYAFSRRGYPSLLMQGGRMVEDGTPNAEEARARTFDIGRAIRLLRLAFYVSEAVVDTPDRPQSSAAGRQRMVQP